MALLIVNYGMGNLASAKRSFEECGAKVVVSEDPAAARTAERIVIPGVGSFANAMKALRERGWIEALAEAVSDGVPILGICLGMQVLADEGEEGGGGRGLGLIHGRVTRMVPVRPDERVPHVGWNEVQPTPGSPLFNGIEPGTDFFFVHSYRFVPEDRGVIAAVTPYCGEVVSAVQHGKVFGVQFHPEKSSRAGRRVIRNFLSC